MYTFFWNSFPSQLSDVKDALPLVLDAWRGNPVDQDQAVLAAFNVIGFVYKAALGKDGPQPMMASSAAEVEGAFAAAMNPTMGADDAKALPWGLILSVAMELLKKWLK